MVGLHRRINLVNKTSDVFYALSRISICTYGVVHFLASILSFPPAADGFLRVCSCAFAFLGLLIEHGLDLHRVKVHRFFQWYTGILVFSMITSIYSPSDGSYYRSVILNTLILGTIFTLCVNSEENIDRFLWEFSLSGIIVFVLLYSSGQLHVDDRLGRTLTGDNTNSFAQYIMLIMFASIALFYLSDKKIKKIISVVALLVTGYMIMLSGGRKYIIAPLIMIIFIMLIKTEERNQIIKKISIIAMIVLGITLLWRFMMTNTIVYNTIGYRFLNLVSIDNREKYIFYGLKFFADSPLWGHGENAFSTLIFPYVGRSIYSHNNYIELLVNYGLFGFCWYYYFISKMATKLFYYGRKNGDLRCVVFFSLIIACLFLDIGNVSYCDSALTYCFYAISFNLVYGIKVE